MTAEQAPVSTSRAPVHRGGSGHTEVLETARMAAVAHYDILDSAPEGAFDRIAAMAARLMRAPLATISIVDTDRIWFKATYGLDEVTQTAQAPELRGSAILQDEPYVVEDAATDPRTAGTPLVTGETGVRFYAAAPIITTEGHRLGTVDVLDTRPREVNDDELATLTDLAAVVMDELELRLATLRTLDRERELRTQVEGFASALQRALLPPALPSVPGLELACHYHAASTSEVTGDFYDVFPLGDGRWAVFLGDVTGHGAAAAAVTSLVRYTLRTAALHRPDPAAPLEELNSALLLDPEVPQHCTVLFGVLTPEPTGGFDLILASGGHPPALRVHAETGAVEEVYPPGGMLVGALPEAEFATCRVHLQAGQTLLLYTDGITEARPGGEFFGEERLSKFLASDAGASPREQISELTALLESFEPAPTDDVALLALSVVQDEQATPGS